MKLNRTGKKYTLLGLFIVLIFLNMAVHARIITVCDLDGNCRQIFVPEPYGQPSDPSIPTGGPIIDMGGL